MPYAYLIGWSKYNKFYYGIRFAKNCNIDDLWATYFTSSKHVKEFRKINGEPDIVQIRREFNDVNTARTWEHKVLRRLRVINNDKWINKTDNISFEPRTGSKNPKLSALNKLKVGPNNPFYGKKHTEGFKVGSNNAMYGIRGDKHPRYEKEGASLGKKWFYDPKTLKAKYFNVSEAPLDWLPGRKSKKGK